MSKTIDKRVVEMEFDNEEFERGIKKSTSSLNSFNSALNSADNSRAFAGLSSNVSDIASGISDLSSRFSTWGIVAMSAISTVTNSIVSELIGAIVQAKQLMEDLTWGNVSSGFSSYEQELKSVQTILSSTGLTIPEIEKELAKIKWYTDETSYEYAAMIDTIQKFTAQGLDLEEATTYVQGIGAMAGLAGAEASEATHAMEGFAKAMATGYMSRNIWASWIQTSGLINKQTKQLFLDAAVNLGTLQKAGEGVYTALDGTQVTIANFDESLTDSKWLTGRVMQTVFFEMGEYSDMLRAFKINFESFSGETIYATDAMELLNEAVGDEGSEAFRIWKETFDETTGSISTNEEAMAKLQSLMESLGKTGFINAQSYRTFTDAINTTKTAVTSAFHSIFKSVFGDTEEAKELWTRLGDWMLDTIAQPFVDIADLFEQWTKRDELIEGFAAIGRTISAIINAFNEAKTEVFGTLDANDLDNYTTKFHTFATNIEESVGDASKLKDVLIKVFTVVKDILDGIKKVWAATAPFRTTLSGILKDIYSWLVNIFDKVGSSDEEGDKVSILTKAFGLLGNAITFVKEKIDQVYSKLSPFVSKLKKEFGTLYQNLLKAFSNDSGEIDWFRVLGTGGLVFALKKMWDESYVFDGIKAVFDGIKNIKEGGLRGIFETIGTYTNAINSQNIKNYSESLRNLAISFGILAASFLVISLIDIGNLAKGLIAMAVALGIVVGAMWALKKIFLLSSAVSGFKGILNGLAEIAKMAVIATSILILSTALLVLAAALGAFALITKMENWWVGLIAMVGSLIVVGVALFALQKYCKPGPLLAAAAAILVVSVAMIALAGAMILFAVAGNIGNTLNTVAVALAGIVIVAGSLAFLTGVLTKMKNFKVGTLLAVAGAILIVSVAMIALAGAFALFTIFTKMENWWVGLIAMAVTLIVVAAAIGVLAKKCEPGSLIAAAGAILLVSVAMIAFAAAITVMAAAVKLFGIWPFIAAVVAIVVVIAAVTIALSSLAALSPAVLVAAGAVAAFGTALIVVGVGALVCAAAIGVLGVGLILLGAGIASIIAGIASIIAAIPVAIGVAIAAIGLGIVMLIGSVGVGIGIIIASIGIGISTLITALGVSIGVAIASLATGIGAAIIIIAGTLSVVLIGVMSSIGIGIGLGLSMIGLGVDNLTASIKKFAEALGEMKDDLTAFSEGVKSLEEVNWLVVVGGIGSFVLAIKDLNKNPITVSSDPLNTLIQELNEYLAKTQSILTSISNAIWNGLTSAAVTAYSKGVTVGSNAYNAANSYTYLWKNIGYNCVIGFANAIDEYTWYAEARSMAMANAAAVAANDALGIESPSRVFAKIGKYTVEGFVKGIDDNASAATSRTTSLMSSAISAAQYVAENISGILDSDYNPTITPVIDLSNVRNGANEISSMLSANQTYGLSADIAGVYSKNQNESSQTVIARLDQNQLASAIRSGLSNNNTTLSVNFEGSLAQLAAVLQPYIVAETARRGPSLINA